MSYAIIVTDARSGIRTDLCHVGTNPEPVARALREKTIKIGKRNMRHYSNVEVVKLAEGAP